MKKLLFILLSGMWILYFIAFPQDAFLASCDGILLWLYQILPALLPYTILSGLLVASGVFSGRKKSAEWFVVLCGFLFGFPMGSKLSGDFCEQGYISKKRAQHLCAFTNNMSPVFVSTFVLGAQLQRPDLLPQTYLVLYGVPFLYGMIGLVHLHRKYPYTITVTKQSKTPAQRFDLNMQIIDAGILKSFETLIRLCGYIVMFSIMAHMIAVTPLHWEWMNLAATGILEVTNGIVALANSSLPFQTKYLLAVAMLSFGGISGIAQTGSMIRESGLSIGPYIGTKLFLTVLTTAAAAWMLGMF